MNDAKKVVINPCASLPRAFRSLPESRLCSDEPRPTEGRSARILSTARERFAITWSMPIIGLTRPLHGACRVRTGEPIGQR